MATLHWFFCMLRWTVRIDPAIAGLRGHFPFAFVPTYTWRRNCATCFAINSAKPRLPSSPQLRRRGDARRTNDDVFLRIDPRRQADLGRVRCYQCCQPSADARPESVLCDTRRWGGLLKIPQPRMLSWLFEGGDREEHDGVDRHGPIVRRVYILR